MAIVALGLFLVGSAFCVFLDRLDLFVAARVVQAAGGGALVPIAMAAAADMFPLERRALVLGIIGGAAEAGGVLGPIYGASLAALWNWRLIFLVNIPSVPDPHGGLLATAAAGSDTQPTATIAATSRGAGTRRQASGKTRWWQRGRVDYVGAALMALALAGVTIGLGTGTQTVDASTATASTPVQLALAGGQRRGLRRLHPLRAPPPATPHPPGLLQAARPSPPPTSPTSWWARL